MNQNTCQHTQQAYAYHYIHVYDAPPKEEWDGTDGTISAIMRDLRVPRGSRKVVRKVMAEVLVCWHEGLDWHVDCNSKVILRNLAFLSSFMSVFHVYILLFILVNHRLNPPPYFRYNKNQFAPFTKLLLHLFHVLLFEGT